MYFRTALSATPTAAARPLRFNTGSSRLSHVDTVRGVLLVLMAINHIPSDLHAITDHPLGFMSAAEGFVFLAGLMAGYVYTRTGLRSGIRGIFPACKKRAVSIYRWHLCSFLTVLAGLMAIGFVAGELPANTPASFLVHPSLTLLTGAVLVQQPALFDILPMYCALLLVTPWCLQLLFKNAHARLLGGSLALWLAANLFCAQRPFDRGLINTGAFNLAAWQFLYVTGLPFGHRWARRAQDHSHASVSPHLLPTPSKGVLAGLLAFATLLFCVRHGYLPTGLSAATLDALTNKNNLAPIRLLDTALLVYLVYLAVSRFPRAFSWRPFAWIGRASLTVFSVHIVVAYAIQAKPEFFDSPSGRWAGTGFMLVALGLAATFHARFLTTKSAASPEPTEALPPLHPRQNRKRHLIVRHESRPAFPADPLHSGSR